MICFVAVEKALCTPCSLVPEALAGGLQPSRLHFQVNRKRLLCRGLRAAQVQHWEPSGAEAGRGGGTSVSGKQADQEGVYADCLLCALSYHSLEERCILSSVLQMGKHVPRGDVPSFF